MWRRPGLRRNGAVRRLPADRRAAPIGEQPPPGVAGPPRLVVVGDIFRAVVLIWSVLFALSRLF